MSELREPLPAQPVLSVMSAEWPAFWPGLRGELEERLGTVDFESEPLLFDHTAFYEPEFGAPIHRRLLAFGPLVGQEELVGLKLWADALERRLARTDGRRRVNLDPGLLTMERVVLATGKNFTHRIYLGQGVFADLTLIYKRGKGWQALPWTFADYASEPLRGWLERIRERYWEKLQSLGAQGAGERA